MKVYELYAENQKSFYGKAIIKEDNEGQTLYSYNTAILTIKNNGDMVRHWSGWSATTGKHIKAFSGLNKAAYMAMEVIQ